MEERGGGETEKGCLLIIWEVRWDWIWRSVRWVGLGRENILRRDG